MSQSVGYDSRIVSIQTLPLYNQRHLFADPGAKNWKGNWVLRRKRLDLIDSQFRQIRPDLLILQSLMFKKGSDAENDQSLLDSGALSGYNWQKVDLHEYDDTWEVESMAVASNAMFQIPGEKAEIPWKKLWTMGRNSYLSGFKVVLEGSPVLVMNIDLKHSIASQERWYRFVSQRILETQKETGICGQRTILAGHFGGSEGQPDYINMIKALSLRDTAHGFCEKESSCYTDSSENDLYLLTKGDKRPSRSIRILVHKEALVYTATRNFDKISSRFEISAEETLSALPPSPYFGWLSTIRLPRCHSYEAL